MNKTVLKAIILLIIINSLIGGCSYLNKKVGIENDNFVEQFIEQQIENQTGIEIDLTPEDECPCCHQKI